MLYAPESMKKKALAEAGIEEEQCRFLKVGEKLSNANSDIRIETVAAYNNMKSFHPKHKEFLGYLVTMDGITYYVAGDTDVTADNKQVKCDVALVPIGGTYTMDKQQAAELIGIIKPEVAIPTHYGDIVGNPKDGKDFVALVEAMGIRAEIRL